jgi:hypothetical protein
MNDPSLDRGDPLERVWRALRSAEPPEFLYHAIRQGIRETPQRLGQARLASNLAGLAAVIGIVAIVVGGALWSARPVGPGITSSASPSATAPPASSPATFPPGWDPSAPQPGKLWSKDGQLVPWNVLALAGGPEHCGWGHVLFLRMDARLGEPNRSVIDLMEYVRDNTNAWATASADPENPDAPRTVGRFEPSVRRPADAVFTGYVYADGMELWRSEAAGTDAVFLRRGDVWEQWPRSAVPIACA